MRKEKKKKNHSHTLWHDTHVFVLLRFIWGWLSALPQVFSYVCSVCLSISTSASVSVYTFKSERECLCFAIFLFPFFFNFIFLPLFHRFWFNLLWNNFRFFLCVLSSVQITCATSIYTLDASTLALWARRDKNLLRTAKIASFYMKKVVFHVRILWCVAVRVFVCRASCVEWVCCCCCCLRWCRLILSRFEIYDLNNTIFFFFTSFFSLQFSQQWVCVSVAIHSLNDISCVVFHVTHNV